MGVSTPCPGPRGFPSLPCSTLSLLDTALVPSTSRSRCLCSGPCGGGLERLVLASRQFQKGRERARNHSGADPRLKTTPSPSQVCPKADSKPFAREEQGLGPSTHFLDSCTVIFDFPLLGRPGRQQGLYNGETRKPRHYTKAR